MSKWRLTGTIRPVGDGSFEVDVTAETDRPVRAKAPTVGAATDEDLEAERDRLASELGSTLDGLARQMVDVLASENKRGRVSLRRVVREIYQPFTSAVHAYGAEATAYGVEQAIRKGVPNMNYAKKAAKSYIEDAAPAPTSSITRYDILGRDQ